MLGALITVAALKSAHAGEYRAYSSNPDHGVLASTNATVSVTGPANPGPAASATNNDPDVGSYYSQTTTYDFQWYPDPGQTLVSDPAPDTVEDATEIYSLSGGPVEAHVTGTSARATASATLSPYSTSFYVDTAYGNPATVRPPTSNQSTTVSSESGVIDTVTLPNGQPGVEVDVTVSASSSASGVAYPGGTNLAWSQVNGIGIRTEAVVYPHAP